MPLDEATRRLAFLLQRDLRRLIERERARVDRGEQVRYDSVSRMATWETRRGDVIGRWYGEIVASYVVRDRILRWSWAGRTALATATHAEVVSREGQSRNVPQLAMSVIGDIDEDDACTLARLGILVARGEGLELRREEAEISFIGLFDSPRPRDGDVQDPSRYSVPPPPVTREPSQPPPRETVRDAQNTGVAFPRGSSPPARAQSSPPPAAPYRSLPPIREIYGPRNRDQQALTQRESGPPPPPAEPTTPHAPVATRSASSPPAAATSSRAPSTPPHTATSSTTAASETKKVREPSRGIFLPVATAVLAGLTKSVPGFRQALFVVSVSTDENEKRRLIVILVAVDAQGILRQVDPSHDLVETAVRMVEADRADGNGLWRKLSARITPKPDGGATLNVDVL